MTNSLLENAYGSIFHPTSTFEKMSEIEKPPVLQAFIILVLISIIEAITSFSGTNIIAFGLITFAYIFIAVISWFFVGAILDFFYSTFSRSHRLDHILTVTAFSLLPWLLIAPIDLYKHAGIMGIAVAIVLSLLVWVWTVVLFVLALTKVLQISIGRTILLLLMPFLGTIIALSWLSGFISNLMSITNIP